MLTIVILLIASLATAPTLGQSISSTDLAEAVQRGWVSVSISGTGGSSGDVLTMSIRRRSPMVLRLRLRPGTVMKSVSGAVQDMLVTRVKGEQSGVRAYSPTDIIELADDREHIYVLEAYCLNFEKDNPSSVDPFTISEVDSQALTLIGALPESARSLGATQAALWLAAGVPKAAIQDRFPVSAVEMSFAERAVAATGTRIGGPGSQRSPSGVQGQAPQATGGFRCADWKERFVQSQQKDSVGFVMEGYRIGFAQGSMSGLMSDPNGTLQSVLLGKTPAPSDRFGSNYVDGLVALLRRPALLADAFDARCADYANAQVSLSTLTVIVAAEIGGVEASKVNEALRLARSGRPESHAAVVAALSAR